MLEHIADFTAWPILTGILVGYVANRIMSGEGKGCCMNLLLSFLAEPVFRTAVHHAVTEAEAEIVHCPAQHDWRGPLGIEIGIAASEGR